MTTIDQAARRAAERVADKLLPEKFKEEMSQIVSNIIAAEFAPLQERLVEAERLLDDARAEITEESHSPKCAVRRRTAMANAGSNLFCCCGISQMLADIDNFLAAKENGNG